MLRNVYNPRTRTARRFLMSLSAVLNNLAATSRTRKQVVSISADFVMSLMALWLAYTLRFGEAFTAFGNSLHVYLIVPIGTIVLFGALGIYRWVVRSSNGQLLKQLLKGSFASALLLVLVMFLAPPNASNPRSLFVIYGMLLLLGTCGLRLAWRGLFAAGKRGEPIAIYGAGSAGQQLAGSLVLGSEYRPAFFIDDNPLLTNTLVAGLPVYGGSAADLGSALRLHEISKIVLAMPSLGNAAYADKVEKLERFALPLLTVPGLPELVSGTVRADEIRDISIRDILGRQEVLPDVNLLGRCVTAKSVLVTGGGGSIGSELCRQIVAQQPARLVVVDNCEANLYHISEELDAVMAANRITAKIEFKPVLCSVTDRERMRRLIADNRIDTVYHAAAYKHVPIIERHPEQGVEVNIFGTLAVLDAALSYGVDHFVLISTDKAVRPTNAMGASKRAAELILQAKAGTATHTRVCMVRFGNVLGSSGSVVPKFKKQIEAGGPITLTDPDISRYFMTIPEAAQLVLQAGAIAQGGDVFVLDMGAPVRIEDMARTMVNLYGKRLAKDTGNPADIEIVIEGLRPGEKMYEEMFITDSHVQTTVSKVFTANEAWASWAQLQERLNLFRNTIDAGDTVALRRHLLDLAELRDLSVSYGPIEVGRDPSAEIADERASEAPEADSANQNRRSASGDHISA